MRTLISAAALLAATLVPASAAPYTLFIYEQADQLALRTATDDAAAAYWAAYDLFGKDLAAAGVLRGGSALNTGSPISLVDAGVERAADSSYTASPLALGGYFQIDVPTDAEAIVWARKLPTVGGVVEVKAGYPVPGMKM